MSLLVLQVGREYRMRNGDRATIDSILSTNPYNADRATPRPVIGYTENHGLCAWGPDGSASLVGGDSALDLIEEWREPRRLRRFIALIVDDDDYGNERVYPSQLHESRSKLIRKIGAHRIKDIQEVILVEGQNPLTAEELACDDCCE